MNFDQACELLAIHEKGYVNDPNDPGGETNRGVSARTYPNEDIKNMTIARSKFLFMRDFWAPCSIDAMPGYIRFDVFDMAINSGPVPAVKALQRAIGVFPDGKVGPKTLMAISSNADDRVLRRFNAYRMLYCAEAKNWKSHGRGWTIRIANNMLRT